MPILAYMSADGNEDVDLDLAKALLLSLQNSQPTLNQSSDPTTNDGEDADLVQALLMSVQTPQPASVETDCDELSQKTYKMDIEELSDQVSESGTESCDIHSNMSFKTASVNVPVPNYAEPEEKEIELVISEAGCSRVDAVTALKTYGHDIVEAILSFERKSEVTSDDVSQSSGAPIVEKSKVPSVVSSSKSVDPYASSSNSSSRCSSVPSDVGSQKENSEWTISTFMTNKSCSDDISRGDDSLRDGSSDVASSVVTANTGRQMQAMMFKDEQGLVDESANYQGNLLVAAVESHDTRAVERILNDADINPHMVDANGKTALQIASQLGFDDIVKILLSQGRYEVYQADTGIIEVEATQGFPEDGRFGLDHQGVSNIIAKVHKDSWANKYTDLEQHIDCRIIKINDIDTPTFQSLLDAKKSLVPQQKVIFSVQKVSDRRRIEIKDQHPLVLAADGGHLGVVQALVEHSQMKHDNSDFRFWTSAEINHAFLNACAHQRLPIVDYLLEHPLLDVNVNIPLIPACVSGNLQILTKLLEHPKIDVDKVGDGLCAAVLYPEEHRLPVVQKLLDFPAIDVNRFNDNGHTPLSLACKFGHLEIVKKLLEQPAVEVNKRDGKYATPLYLAAAKNHFGVVQQLLEHPLIEVNTSTDFATALLTACFLGHEESVHKFLEHPEIDVNKTNERNMTPLFMASIKGHSAIVQKLLKHPTIHVNEAMPGSGTPLFVASQHGRLEIVEHLLEHPLIDVTKAQNDGATPLYTASEHGYLEIVQKLLNHPDTNDETQKEFSMAIASQNGHQEIVNLLRNYQSSGTTNVTSEVPSVSVVQEVVSMGFDSRQVQQIYSNLIEANETPSVERILELLL